MTGRYDTVSYVRLAADFRSALAWIANIGVSTSGTRFTAYQKIVERLADDFESGRLQAMSEDDVRQYEHSILEALYEAIELTRIHAGLANYDLATLAPKLYKLAKGPERYRNESLAGSEARNTSFELLLGALLRSVGVDPRFADADLTPNFSGRTIFIECKRPQHKRAIAYNVRRASTQLKERRKGSEGVGVVALDLTKALNPEFYRQRIDDRSLLATYLGILVRNAYVEQRGRFELSSRKHVAGVMIRYSALLLDVQAGTHTYGHQLSLFINSNAGADDISALQALMEHMDAHAVA
jgi:hypothetical protein